MNAPRLLRTTDLPAFCALRRAALVDAPWAFLATPDDDIGSDPTRLAAKLAEPENVVLVIEQDRDPGQFVACAGLVRETAAKLRHRAFICGHCAASFWAAKSATSTPVCSSNCA